ncbi:20529_t:CDS:1, partial [Gigaspora margarita]
MKQSWGFFIAKQYNYKFENFYAVVIQRAYRNYKKRPKSLAKRVWEAVRNDGTPDRWKYLGIIPRNESYYYINGELIKFNGKIDFFNSLYGHTMYSARTWAKEKRNQLAYRLNWMVFEP